MVAKPTLNMILATRMIELPDGEWTICPNGHVVEAKNFCTACGGALPKTGNAWAFLRKAGEHWHVLASGLDGESAFRIQQHLLSDNPDMEIVTVQYPMETRTERHLVAFQWSRVKFGRMYGKIETLTYKLTE